MTLDHINFTPLCHCFALCHQNEYSIVGSHIRSLALLWSFRETPVNPIAVWANQSHKNASLLGLHSPPFGATTINSSDSLPTRGERVWALPDREAHHCPWAHDANKNTDGCLSPAAGQRVSAPVVGTQMLATTLDVRA